MSPLETPSRETTLVPQADETGAMTSPTGESTDTPTRPARQVRRAEWIAAQREGVRGRPSSTKRWRNLFVSIVPIGLLLGCAVATVVRLCMQDRLAGLPTYLFYASPPIVLASTAGLATLIWSVARAWRLVVVGLIPTVLFGIWAGQTTWSWRPVPVVNEANEVRVVFWNAGRGMTSWQRVAQTIRGWDADVVVLVEGLPHISMQGKSRKQIDAECQANMLEMRALWHAYFPQRSLALFETGITVLARGEIDVHDYSSRATYGRYARCDVQIGEHTLPLMVADIYGPWDARRRKGMASFYRVLNDLPPGPLLIVGDFNTPTDATLLNPLRRGFVNAFEWAGRGYAATWPIPLPVLTIDQAWVRDGIEVLDCTHGWTTASDHRPINLQLVLPPTNND